MDALKFLVLEEKECKKAITKDEVIAVKRELTKVINKLATLEKSDRDALIEEFNKRVADIPDDVVADWKSILTGVNYVYSYIDTVLKTYESGMELDEDEKEEVIFGSDRVFAVSTRLSTLLCLCYKYKLSNDKQEIRMYSISRDSYCTVKLDGFDSEFDMLLEQGLSLYDRLTKIKALKSVQEDVLKELGFLGCTEPIRILKKETEE